MAGIERLEVHSRSYIVRWVKVDEGNTLSWSVQPHKKSINFGLVKHPGSGATTLVSSTTDSLDDETRGVSEAKTSRFSKKDITAQELLKSKGFIPIKWIGKCEADKVSMDTYDVQQGQSGMYGLVFDNTFSKQTSKTATFVVLTYPTGAPPQTSSHLPNLQSKAAISQTSLARQSATNLDGAASASFDSLHSHKAGGKATSISGKSEVGSSSNYHVGSLHKRRRKKGQGYARRFFSLDYSTCTLSYYYNPKSSALRGAIPLSLAAIAADQRRREISIDSGAEVWHLKAPNDKEFQDWARALEKASRIARGLETVDVPSAPVGKIKTQLQSTYQSSPQEDREWEQVEALVSRVVGTRDALRRLTKEVAAVSANMKHASPPQYLSPASGSAIEEGDNYFAAGAPERKSFWRRKSTTPGVAPGAALVSGTALAVPSPGSATTAASANSVPTGPRHRSRGSVQEESVEDHCQSLLMDLDSVVAEFSTLINNSKRRRLPVPPSAGGASRKSIDSVSTADDEFFDAEDTNNDGVVKIATSEDETPGSDVDEGSLPDNSSISSMGEEEAVGVDEADHLFPSKPKSLTPLPIETAVARRTSIPASTVLPPSLIAFVRKNVGKDLSTISMPVSANEPLSLLQKVAEQLEYAQLLNQAAKQSSPTDRLLFVAAFAVSQFSSGRAKERAIRKPFNPLLGETFELVRSDKEVPGGFRLLVEKVSHRPVVLAMQADSASWSFSQSPAPGQKFWGKSAEITTDGRVRIVLRLSNGQEERYSWNIATMFLRNVVMGEKYVEPVGTMHVVNDSTGHKAAVEFKSKGMFGGRAEDVSAEIFSPEGASTGSGLVGNWTTGLKTSGKGGGQDIWRVGSLVDNAAQTYGLTSFATTLNEITEIEKDKLPPTDCRLRPDQRMAEQGKLDEAEEWKHALEEAQRARRRDMEERGESYKPRWFVKAEGAPEGEEVWKLRSGKESYWEERAKGTWQGVEDLFAVADGP